MMLDPTTTAVFLALLTVLVLLFYIARHVSRSNFGEISLPQKVKGHHWLYVQAFPPGKYCNVCETSSFHGGMCDHCGIVADDQCISQADRVIPCKQLACIGSSMRHHWVSGNLPPTAVCEVCETPCDYGPDFRCVWCQNCVHNKCMSSFTSICDFGKLKKMVIPPTCVKLRLVGWKGNRHFVVKEVTPSLLRELRPGRSPSP